MERNKELELWLSFRGGWRLNFALFTVGLKIDRQQSSMEFCKFKALAHEWQFGPSFNIDER